MLKNRVYWRYMRELGWRRCKRIIGWKDILAFVWTPVQLSLTAPWWTTVPVTMLVWGLLVIRIINMDVEQLLWELVEDE